MMNAKLLVVGGEIGSQEIPLALPAVIGRGRDVSVNLSHPLVSRRHCQLADQDGWLVVRDLHSLNGTFVGSERIEEAYLRPGELLTVGTVTFRAQYDAPAGAELPPLRRDRRSASIVDGEQPEADRSVDVTVQSVADPSADTSRLSHDLPRSTRRSSPNGELLRIDPGSESSLDVPFVARPLNPLSPSLRPASDDSASTY